MAPFVYKDQVPPSFLEAFLKRKPKFNAIIDINNLLANKPLKDVTVDEVQYIAQTYNLNINNSYREYIQDFYSLYLRHCFTQQKLNQNEVDNLLHLKKILALSDKETKAINEVVATRIYTEETIKAVEDGRLSEEEKAFLEQLKSTLALQEEIAAKIYAQAAQNYFSQYFNSIISDDRISEDEERELYEIAKSLGVEVTMDEVARDTFDKMRVMWLIENNKIPSIEVNLPLKKSERCYFKSYCLLCKETENNGNKKFEVLNLNKKGLASLKPEDQLDTLDKGTLYVTNKRIIFNGAKRTESISISKLMEFSEFLNGVEVTSDDREDIFFLFYDNIDILSAILKKIANRH